MSKKKTQIQICTIALYKDKQCDLEELFNELFNQNTNNKYKELFRKL